MVVSGGNVQKESSPQTKYILTIYILAAAMNASLATGGDDSAKKLDIAN